MVGHCLVWAKDDRTDAWMMEEDGQPVSREKLLQRIETHINTVVGRYADVVSTRDVVNEAIGDSNEGLLRDSVYSRTTDINFIVTAFKAARAADPDALLIYNDYNGHKADIREKLIDQYVELFQLFDEYSDVIARVSFWNPHDGQSWINYFPWQRDNYPLLFDRDRQPKPAFEAVYKVLAKPRS